MQILDTLGRVWPIPLDADDRMRCSRCGKAAHYDLVNSMWLCFPNANDAKRVLLCDSCVSKRHQIEGAVQLSRTIDGRWQILLEGK